MTRKLIPGACVVALTLAVCLYASPARCSPLWSAATQYGTLHAYNGVATSLDGLSVYGATYDVTFVQATTLQDVTALGTPLGLDNGAAAIDDVVSALRSVNNGGDLVTMCGPAPSFGSNELMFYLSGPYSSTNGDYDNTEYTNYEQNQGTSTGYWLSATSGDVYANYLNYIAFAQFTPVPEPDTGLLLLAGLGLIGLIGLRRKFKGQIHTA